MGTITDKAYLVIEKRIRVWEFEDSLYKFLAKKLLSLANLNHSRYFVKFSYRNHFVYHFTPFGPSKVFIKLSFC